VVVAGAICVHSQSRWNAGSVSWCRVAISERGDELSREQFPLVRRGTRAIRSMVFKSR